MRVSALYSSRNLYIPDTTIYIIRRKGTKKAIGEAG
jgi:hypothetical protein